MRPFRTFGNSIANRLLGLAGGGVGNPDPLYTFQLFGDSHIGSISQARLDAVTNDKPIAPLCLVGAGDITEDGTDLQDAAAIAWMASVNATSYVVNGGHDVQIHTPAQFATAYGMSGQNWTIELSYCFVIGVGMDSAGSSTLSQTQLDYLDTQLSAAGTKPCVIVCHVPLFYSHRNTDLTHYLSSDQTNWYILPDTNIRTVLANYACAKAWLSGHIHAPYTSIDFVKNEMVGDHNVAVIAGSSPFYTDIVTGEAGSLIVTQYVTVTNSGIEVRTRDHGNRRWLAYYNAPYVVDTPVSPSFNMQFSADDAAPISVYTPADVGVLQSYVPNDLIAISGGRLVANGSNASHQYFFSIPVMYRKCGRSLRLDYPVRTTPADCTIRLLYGNNTYLGLQTQGTTQVRTHNFSGNVVTTDTVGTSASWSFLLIMQTTGGFICARDEGDTANVWKLLYVRNDGQMALQPRLHLPLASMNVAFDNYKIEDLSGALTIQFGIATGRVAISSNGETLTATADGIFEHTIVAATGVTQEFMFRRVDDDNTWIIRMDQGASTLEAFSKVTGSETSRGSAVQAWTNGTSYRIVISARGSLIQVCVADQYRSLSITSTIMATNAGLKVSHAGTELVAWPATLTI